MSSAMGADEDPQEQDVGAEQREAVKPAIVKNKASTKFHPVFSSLHSDEAYTKAVAAARTNLDSDYMRNVMSLGKNYEATVKASMEVATNDAEAEVIRVMSSVNTDNSVPKVRTNSTVTQVKEHKYTTPMFLGGPYDGSRLQVDKDVKIKVLKGEESTAYRYVERLFHSQPTMAGQSTVYRLFVLETLTSEQIMTALVDGYAGYFADNS